MKINKVRALAAFSCFAAAAACGETEKPYEFHGVLAAPPEGETKGSLLFLPGDSFEAAAFGDLATKLSERGWSVAVPDGGEKAWTAALSRQFDPEKCTVAGGFGEAGPFAMKYGAEHEADGVDGVILMGGNIPEGETYMINEFPAAIITAEFDSLVTSGAAQMRGKDYPAHSFFINIRGGSRAGFVPGAHFDTDGEATMPPEEQQRVTFEIVDDLMKQLCAGRERRIRELARKAARRAAGEPETSDDDD